MKTYAISGLGADERVFQKLNLDFEIIVIKWIKPLKNESIYSHASRLSSQINHEDKFNLIGVSFGGIIASEISKIKKPVKLILISSIETKFELPTTYRILGKLRFVELFPKSWFKIPTKIAKFFFGAKNDKLLFEILKDADLEFTKWGIIQILNWKNLAKFENSITIVGEKDKLFPIKKKQYSHIIKNGEHFMIVDRAEEISDVLNHIIK